MRIGSREFSGGYVTLGTVLVGLVGLGAWGVHDIREKAEARNLNPGTERIAAFADQLGTIALQDHEDSTLPNGATFHDVANDEPGLIRTYDIGCPDTSGKSKMRIAVEFAPRGIFKWSTNPSDVNYILMQRYGGSADEDYALSLTKAADTWTASATLPGNKLPQAFDISAPMYDYDGNAIKYANKDMLTANQVVGLINNADIVAQNALQTGSCNTLRN